jgi:hypothetical protein
MSNEFADASPIIATRTDATVMAEGIASAQAADSAKDSGFKNVNQKWLDKTISFDEGIKLLTDGRSETEDIELPIEEVDFEESNDQLVVNIGGNLFTPTEHALCQLGTKLKIPAKILTNWYKGDKTDITVVADILANGKRRLLATKDVVDEDGNAIEPSDWLWRTRKDGSLRATLSKKYKKMDNLWYLEALSKIVPDGRLSHWDRCDGSDTIYGNILIPDSLRAETDSEYGGGLSVGNSEIGVRTLSCNPWLFRWICFNGCIWDKIKGVSYIKKHLGTKIDYTAEFEKLKDCINKQIPLIPAHIDTLLDTKNLTWSSTVHKLLAQAANDLTLSKKQATVMLECYEVEPEKSCFGLINAITRASQKMPADTWVAMDTYATKLMQQAFWDTYSSKASAIEDKEARSYFALAS